MNEEVQERQTVTIGKPLVSKLNLHEPRPSCSASSFFSQDSFDFVQCSSSTEDLVFAGSNPRPHCMDTDRNHQTDSGLPHSLIGSNMPVETEAPETADAPHPLVAGESLPHNYTNDINCNFSDMCNFHSY